MSRAWTAMGYLFVWMIVLYMPHPLYAWDARDLKQLLASGQCDGCDLADADLRNTDLVNAKLRWARLHGADLRGAQMASADLTGADLHKARLQHTDLKASVLQGADLRGVDLSETQLTGADLRWADLSHLDVDLAFESVELIGVLLEGARFKDEVRCGPLPSKGGFGCAAVP